MSTPKHPTTRIPTAVTISRVLHALGRCGLSVRGYDFERTPSLTGVHGLPAYGASPHDGAGRPFVGCRGRPLIQLSDRALQDTATAVTTIFHEIAHHRAYRRTGNGGTEGAAEAYGQRMYERFARRQARPER